MGIRISCLFVYISDPQFYGSVDLFWVKMVGLCQSDRGVVAIAGASESMDLCLFSQIKISGK